MHWLNFHFHGNKTPLTTSLKTSHLLQIGLQFCKGVAAIKFWRIWKLCIKSNNTFNILQFYTEFVKKIFIIRLLHGEPENKFFSWGGGGNWGVSQSSQKKKRKKTNPLPIWLLSTFLDWSWSPPPSTFCNTCSWKFEIYQFWQLCQETLFHA